MNRSDLRELMGRLETLEALAKLFNNLWFDKIREDIKDTKVQAYLTVFDDAFPQMNHVIEFVRRSAGLLSGGDATDEQWQRMQSEFDYLHRLLKSQGEDVVGVAAVAVPVDDDVDPGVDVFEEEREALESVEQSDIDSLSDEGEDIDALFAPETDEDDAPSGAAELIDEEATTGEDEDEDGLAELLEDVDEEDMADEDVDLESLLEESTEGEVEESSADDDVDLEDLLEEEEEDDVEEDEDDVAAGISEDEMTALLDGDAEGKEDEAEEGASTNGAGDEADDDDETTSQDEIDALFG